MRTATPLLASLVLALGLGCGDRAAELETPITWLDQKLALGDQLLLVDSTGDRAFLIDVTAEPPDPEPQVVALPHGATTLWKRNAGDEALILCSGRRAAKGQDAEPAVLAALAPDGELRNYALGANPFDQLAQSDDGRFALLWKSGMAQRLLDNPNEIAIVDLERKPDAGAVTLRSLRSFGDSPLGVVFSPPMLVLGEERRLAVVLSRSNVTLIDLDHLERVETTVQLSSAGGSAVQPIQVLFNPDAAEIYVRGASSADVYVLNLGERPGAGLDEDGAEHNDFRPFIDQLGVGGRPDDMDLYRVSEGSRLLVLVGGSQVAVVEASTSQVTSVSLPMSASAALLFSGVSPRDRQIGQRALLYQPGASALMFLDLEELEERGTRNLEPIAIGSPLADLLPMPGEQRALIIHASGGVSLLDLEGRTVSPITSNAQLTDAAFDPDRGRLWVAPANQEFVAFLDLATGDTPEIRLDAPVRTLVPMFDVGRVVVLHDSALGYLTVLDADEPARETAYSLRGFTVADLLSGDE